MKNKNAVHHRVSSTFKRADIFGQGLTFTVDGNEKYPSVFGAFVSMVIFVALLMYGTNKFKVMLDHDDTVF